MNERAPLTRVALMEGNATLRRLLVEVLTEGSFEPISAQLDGELADLLVIDVDSNVSHLDEYRGRYQEGQRPILTVGLKHSREAHAEGPWLTRPFSGATILQHCWELLGVKSVDEPTDEVSPMEIPPPIATAFVDEPPTVEIDPDEVLALEGQLGLAPGKLAEHARTRRSQVEDVIDLSEFDDAASMIVSIEEISSVKADGGTIVSGIEAEVLPIRALEEQAASLIIPSPIRAQSPHSTTLPDAPAVVLGQGSRLGPPQDPSIP
ncbi:MAG: hypothetical protein ACNA8W_23735, partial [Bradymonadaceae bacterium]